MHAACTTGSSICLWGREISALACSAPAALLHHPPASNPIAPPTARRVVIVVRCCGWRGEEVSNLLAHVGMPRLAAGRMLLLHQLLRLWTAVAGRWQTLCRHGERQRLRLSARLAKAPARERGEAELQRYAPRGRGGATDRLKRVHNSCVTPTNRIIVQLMLAPLGRRWQKSHHRPPTSHRPCQKEHYTTLFSTHLPTCHSRCNREERTLCDMQVMCPIVQPVAYLQQAHAPCSPSNRPVDSLATREMTPSGPVHMPARPLQNTPR